MAHIFIDAFENWSDLHAALIMQEFIQVITLVVCVISAEKVTSSNQNETFLKWILFGPPCNLTE